MAWAAYDMLINHGTVLGNSYVENQPKPPNGLRVSGERGGEADERVRCTRMLGGPTTIVAFGLGLRLPKRCGRT